MNRSIDRPTRNALFDEKMGDTVHFAFSHSLPPSGPGNDSAVHVDVLVDVRESGTIEIGGETAYRDGRFRWESGFTG